VKQRFTIQCPRLIHQEYTLGNDDQWALQVDPGAASCWIDLQFSGDELSGDLRWREDQLSLRTLATGRNSTIAAKAMQGALDRIDRLHAHATISGSAAKPKLHVRSNLGADLSRGLQLAARRELSLLQEKLSARLEREVNEQVSRLADELSTEQSELLTIVQSHKEIFAGLQQLGTQLDLPQEILGVRLPLSNLIRRRITPSP